MPMSAAASDDAPRTAESMVHQLVSLQEFDGYWASGSGLHNRLAHFMNCDVNQIAADHLHSDLNSNMWMTALVVVFMEDKLASEKSVWEMIVEKARRWLEQQSDAAKSEEVLERARKVVG